MSGDAHLILAVVTCPRGALLVHRPGEDPPAFFPGSRPLKGEKPGTTAERGVLEDTRLRVRTGKVIGRHPHAMHRRPVVYVAATPLDDVTEVALSMSLAIGWYSLEQVAMLLPDLHPPVREHLAATIRRR